MSGDSASRWAGPWCPECDYELEAEPLATADGMVIVYSCVSHGPIQVERPFE
jgi:hypothetical protein